MRALRAWRTLLRVEVRQLVRHHGRSALIVALIAVPVAAVVGGSALYRTTRPTVDEKRAQVLGRAALRIGAGGAADAFAAFDRLRERLPDGTRTTPLFSGQEKIGAPGRSLGARFFVVEPGSLERDGLATGLVALREGRFPRKPDEVALSAPLVRGLGRTIGDAVTLHPGVDKSICGVIVDPESVDMPVVVRAVDPEQPYGAATLLVDLPDEDAIACAARLRAEGEDVAVRAEIGGEDGFVDVVIFVVGGLGFIEAALVVAAAFAVGFRRRQREIGLLGASGASVGGMRASLIASAAVLAVIGGVAGALVGAGAARVLHPFLDEWTRRMNGPFELSRLHLAGALVLGVVTSMASAAVPAWTATRLPIRVALSGRRPVPGSARRWLIAGVAAIVVGVGLMAIGASRPATLSVAVLIGGAGAVLGLGACAPWVLDALAHLAGPLPLSWRLAIRDAGRFRARNGPVVAAILAGMSASVLLAALVGGIDAMVEGRLPRLRDDQLRVVGPGAEVVAGRLATELGGVGVSPLLAVHHRGAVIRAALDLGPGRANDGWIACGDERILAALGAEAARGEFLGGALIAMSLPPESTPRFDASTGLDEVTVARVDVDQPLRAPVLLMHRDRVAELGLRTGPAPGSTLVPWMVRLEGEVGPTTLDRAHDMAADEVGTSVDAHRMHGAPTGVFFRVVLALSLVTGLIVIAVATALSSLESANDRRILHAVGAAPGLLRRHVAAKAAYLALLGCVLAVPAGLIPYAGLVHTATGPLGFHLPWGELAVVVLALPAIAYGGTWIHAWIARGRAA